MCLRQKAEQFLPSTPKEVRSSGPLLSVTRPHRAAASLLSQLGLPAGPAPSGELPLGSAWPGRPGQLCPAEAAADPAVACARGGRSGGGGGQEPWAPGVRGYIMYHLPAPLRPGIGFLCLLLAGAAWAPPPNPTDPKFENKGKGGVECGPQHWILEGNIGTRTSCPDPWGHPGSHSESVTWGPRWCLNP